MVFVRAPVMDSVLLVSTTQSVSDKLYAIAFITAPS